MFFFFLCFFLSYHTQRDLCAKLALSVQVAAAAVVAAVVVEELDVTVTRSPGAPHQRGEDGRGAHRDPGASGLDTNAGSQRSVLSLKEDAVTG